MNFFVFSSRRYWGVSSKSLFDALTFAHIRVPNKLETFADNIGQGVEDGDSHRMAEILKDAKANYQDEMESLKYEKETEIIVCITSDYWKLHEVDGMTGTPSWVPRDGTATNETAEKFEETRLYLSVMPDGTIKERKQ